MEESEFDLDMDELSSAEDFLDYFCIAYDPSVVHVNRLHILQRFHDYLDHQKDINDSNDEQKREIYASLLNNAYNDFVGSNAQQEKVFKVFQEADASLIKIPINKISKGT